MAAGYEPDEMPMLRALARSYPTVDSAVAELAALRARLTLPKGVVHVISDVHGEYKKLRHVINNASGRLRPLVAEMFNGRLSEADQRDLLAVLYYPREMMDFLRPKLADKSARREWVRKTLRLQFEIIRALARNYRREEVACLIPEDRKELFEELMDEPLERRDPGYVDTILDWLAVHDKDWPAVRAASRLVRNLSASEILVAGDLGDRGERIDRVIDYLIQQPHVSIVWGNHDMSWMGACLGNEACIATVLRFSLRYRRISQLEEGYGVIMSPLEKLARDIYGDDPVTNFIPKGEGLRETLTMARMQKAAAILQLKLEGQASRRHSDWGMEHRNLLHRMDRKAGTVEIDGKIYPLTDTHFPTVNPEDAYALSDDERKCMDRLRESFVGSQRLWQHMSWVARRGTMWTRRDDALIFHACVPVDDDGNPLAVEVEGRPLAGRELMDAMGSIIRRCYRKGAEGAGAETDWFWYLWAAPSSPLFGKDKMATFEGYFVADKQSHEEHKNPYFTMIHDANFVKKIGAQFGMGPDVLVVNGHVPVKIEKGEDPVKKGGNAVTIDGAFSEAYGDKGYSLLLVPTGIDLAEHHHFDSVAEVITTGKDIAPKVRTIRSYDKPRKIGDTEEGDESRQTIADLEKLIHAYEEGILLEKPTK
jgi:fructose-1,6-bisphosphatase III